MDESKGYLEHLTSMIVRSILWNVVYTWHCLNSEMYDIVAMHSHLPPFTFPIGDMHLQDTAYIIWIIICIYKLDFDFDPSNLTLYYICFTNTDISRISNCWAHSILSLLSSTYITGKSIFPLIKVFAKSSSPWHTESQRRMNIWPLPAWISRMCESLKHRGCGPCKDARDFRFSHMITAWTFKVKPAPSGRLVNQSYYDANLLL